MAEMANRDLLYREFGILLASERRRKHLSQAQFSARVGLSRTSITNIECGRQPIQLHQLYLFASVLRSDLLRLLPKEPIANDDLAPAKTLDESHVLYIEQAKKMIAREIANDQGGIRCRRLLGFHRGQRAAIAFTKLAQFAAIRAVRS